MVGGAARGYFGLDKPTYANEEAYRTAQAIGNMPGFGAPAGIFKAAANAPEVAAALGGLLGKPGVGKLAQSAPKMKAPQDEALEIARKNAVKMLGLPENNTAMDRAKALGFYDGWKHGSPTPDITAFNPSLAGRRGVDFGHATYATKSGDNASGYALNWQEYSNHPEKIAIESKRQSILNRFLDAKNAGDTKKALEVRAELNSIRDGDELYSDFLNYKLPSSGSTVYPLMIRSDKMPWVEGDRNNFNNVNAKAIAEARAAGAPGVRINNVADNSGRFNGTSDVMAVFDPSLIRSRFAAFDPARVNENDLLGRADPRLLALIAAGTGGGLLGYNYLQDR
jgi:hypothetical protein